MSKSKEAATRRWRVGELAAATGLTVRTLHHYEQIGLLVPSGRSSSQHRLYDERDVQRLYRILALRDLGVSLADIGRTVDGDGRALVDVLRDHLARAESELERLAQLRDRLRRICAHTDAYIEIDELLAAIEAMSRVERHIDRRRAMGHEPTGGEAGWRQLGDELRACMTAGCDPSSPPAQAVGRRVSTRIREFAGDDAATMGALALLRRVAPPTGLAGWDPELTRYLDRVLETLDDKDKERDPC